MQHHPEASPGPRDSHYLFDRFVALMEAERDKKRAAERAGGHAMSSSGDMRMETATFEDDGRVPNSRLPAILYRGAHRSPTKSIPALAFERRFAENDWNE